MTSPVSGNGKMQQQISVITLGVDNLETAKYFYCQGFGWNPVFENDEIVFFQMNGFVLGIWLKDKLEADMDRSDHSRPGAFALAHNVGSQKEVLAVIDRLSDAGGKILRSADAPIHGGFRGYVADPDGNAWEIAWNPAWAIDERGLVTFGID